VYFFLFVTESWEASVVGGDGGGGSIKDVGPLSIFFCWLRQAGKRRWRREVYAATEEVVDRVDAVSAAKDRMLV
jgi:hypothetical protein